MLFIGYKIQRTPWLKHYLVTYCFWLIGCYYCFWLTASYLEYLLNAWKRILAFRFSPKLNKTKCPSSCTDYTPWMIWNFLISHFNGNVKVLCMNIWNRNLRNEVYPIKKIHNSIFKKEEIQTSNLYTKLWISKFPLSLYSSSYQIVKIEFYFAACKNKSY